MVRKNRFRGSDRIESNIYLAVMSGEQVETIQSESTWLHRGKQRSAVAKVLLQPMTGSEILERARCFAPKMHLRDVWFALRVLALLFAEQTSLRKVDYFAGLRIRGRITYLVFCVTLCVEQRDFITTIIQRHGIADHHDGKFSLLRNRPC